MDAPESNYWVMFLPRTQGIIID